MTIPSSVVTNTLIRYLNAGADEGKKTFKKIQNLLGFLGKESAEDVLELSKDAAEEKEKEEKPTGILKRIEEKNDHQARILHELLRHTVLEDFKQEGVAKEYNEILNQLPKTIDFYVRKNYAGAIQEVKELIKEDFLTDFTTNFPKYFSSYKRSEGTKEDEGKNFKKSDRAIVRVLAPRGHENALESLIKSTKFKVQIGKTRPSDISVITAPGTFKVPSDKDLEEKLNESGVELTLQTGSTRITLKNEEVQTLKMTLVPGKTYTLVYKGRIKGRGGDQGLFEVEEKAADLSKVESKYGTLSLNDLKSFIQYALNHYIQNLKSKPQEITETEFSKLTKGVSDKELTLDSIMEEAGSVADMASDEDEPDTEATPEERQKKREEEQVGKDKARDRKRRSLGLTEDAWEEFAPGEKDKIENEVDRIKTTIANEYETIDDKTVLGSIKDIMYTRSFVKSFMDFLFEPGQDIGSKKGLKDWKELVRKNAGDWVKKDDTLKKVYLNTVASKTESGSSMASEALAKIKSNESLNKLFEAAVSSLNKEQLGKEEEDRDNAKKQIEKIKEKNISREKDGIKPLPLPSVKKKLKQTHPLVDDTNGKKVNLQSLKKIIESNPELKKAVYSDEDIAKKLTPSMSGDSVDKDVFGSAIYAYIGEFIQDLQKKILEMGPAEFPNLMKILKRKEDRKDDTHPESYRQELKQKAIGDNAKHIPKRKASEFSFFIKNALVNFRNQGK